MAESRGGLKVDELAEIERAKYAKMWSGPDYRRNSPGLNYIGVALRRLGDPTKGTVRDYGTGEGKVLDVLRGRGLEAEGVDIVQLRPDVVEACLWDLPDDMPMTDLATCFDVMEHIPPERVDDVLLAIAGRTRWTAVFQIAHTKCRCGERHGETLHLTIRNRDWWRDKLGEFFHVVEVHATEQKWRTMYVCS